MVALPISGSMYQLRWKQKFVRRWRRNAIPHSSMIAISILLKWPQRKATPVAASALDMEQVLCFWWSCLHCFGVIACVLKKATKLVRFKINFLIMGWTGITCYAFPCFDQLVKKAWVLWSIGCILLMDNDGKHWACTWDGQHCSVDYKKQAPVSCPTPTLP